MRITAVLLLAACLSASAGGFSQKVTLNAKDMPLEQAFAQLKAQTGYVFVFSNEVLQKTVTADIKNIPLDKALDILLKDKALTYTYNGKYVVIAPVVSSKKKVDDLLPPGIIKGRVLDADGQPLSGVSVQIKGTQTGTTTDASGNFTLNAEANSILIISMVGYESKEVKAIGGVLGIVLTRSISSLDESIVIAYGTTTKRLSTSNIGRVKAEDIAKQPVNNPILALQGRVPGVYIEQSTGNAGGTIKVRIQGTNSMQNGNEPFYVIDGMPYSATGLPPLSFSIIGQTNIGGTNNRGYGSALSFINPNDIESIEVLKDADATAIYGSRAGNGAILITTKKAKAGGTKVDINLQSGWGQVGQFLDLLSTRQYLDLRYDAYRNDNTDWKSPSVTANDLKLWDTTRYTDWQKELIGGTARYHDFQASVSGGSNTTLFNLGATYHKENTVYPGDLSDQKASVRFNLNHTSANKKFRFQFSNSYLHDDNLLPPTDLTGSAVTLAPIAPAIYNSDGSPNWAINAAGAVTWSSNPARFLLPTYKIRTDNLLSNALISYMLFPGLDIKTSLGYNKLSGDEILKTPLSAVYPATNPRNRIANYSDKNSTNWIIEPQLTYTCNRDFGTIDFLLGTTFQRTILNAKSIRGTGYNSDREMDNFAAAASLTAIPTLSLLSVYNYNAVFARMNYNLQDKYILNLSARRDGSSRFGSENIFNNFYAIGAAWLVGEEKFIKNKLPFISFAKLRGSFGTTGNDQIGDYSFLDLYSPTANIGVPYQGVTSSETKRLPNPYIQWEETRKLTLGLDVTLLHRLDLTFNYNDNRSSNQLLNNPLPALAGFSSITENIPATIKNSGYEIQVGGTVAAFSSFQWRTNVNMTIASNKLLSFPGLSKSTLASRYAIGQPITLLKAYNYAGVNPKTGVYEFLSAKGELVISPSTGDNYTVINLDPRFYGGWQNTLSYKGLTLDFLFQFVKQTGANYALGNFPGAAETNQPVSIISNIWKQTGDIAALQKATSSNVDVVLAGIAANTSIFGYSDASFVRLKNVSLSYSLPKQVTRSIKIQQARLFAQGQNLFTITKYIGLDPESRSVSSLPPLRVITLGLQCSF